MAITGEEIMISFIEERLATMKRLTSESIKEVHKKDFR